MNENKKKRYPADRAKLHAMLGKKEQELNALKAEVEEIRALTKQADFAAINATAEMYNVTPEQFAHFMEAMKNSQTQAVPPLPVSVKADGEEENPIDIEDA